MKRHIYILAILLLSVLTAACSGPSGPDNPEPTLSISEATGITRTEATVKAAVVRHGSGKLDYVALSYREASADPDEALTIEADPSLSDFSFHITGLRPGVSYTCRLEAGTRTASLRTDAITFTTVPNDPPKLSLITPLSTGPLGIIVKFSILDSGGEPILEAGVEIRESGQTESRRIFTASSGSYPEDMQVSITGLTPSTRYILTPFAINSIGEARGETFEYTPTDAVILAGPGMLASLFGSGDASGLECLAIAGPMNGDDFRTLRTFLGAPSEGTPLFGISDIDLTDARIVEGGGSYDGRRFTVTDCLTTGIFERCTRLRRAVLPNSATAIERNAFAGCTSLEVLTIPARVETLLPSSGCTALKGIEVSGANARFISDQGVLLNADASEILWFPLGKTGEYRFPETVHSIGENAFAGTSVTTLIIPPGVTSISRGAFVGSALTEIRLPDDLVNVSEGLFQNCSALSTVYLGSGTEYVGDFVFDGTSMRDIYLAAVIPPVAMTDTFRDGDSTILGTCTLHVPTGCRKLYSNHRQWGSFSRIEEFQPK